MEISNEAKESIRKWALKNACDYGSASAPKVVGKIMAEHPECRGNAKELMAEVGLECARINSLPKEKRQEEIAQFSFDEKPSEEGEKKIILPDARQGAAITRFPPEPSGYLHIGHAKAIFLNYEGAKNHGGKMRLRMDDTNPAKAKQEFEDAIISDLKWLGVQWSGDISHTSDYMEEFYEYADELIIRHKAYVCTCKAEQIKAGRENKAECLCRAKEAEQNLHEFREMMRGHFDEGKAILRFRGNMKDENTVMRDPTLFRIIRTPHYRLEDRYKCWPSYDFAAPILDSMEGVTHAMRSKEYELRDRLYFAILDELEMRKPKLIHFSRLAIKGAPISKRLINPLIEEGKVCGYDDIRLPTLAALRRRGICAEAIRKFVISFGLSKVESEPGWDKLLNENRKIIDAQAKRKFFAPNPAKVKLKGVEIRNIGIKNHPQNAQLGVREVETSSICYIPSKDAQEIAEGEIFRLKDWCNARCISKSQENAIMPDGINGNMLVIEAQFESDEGMAQKKVQWVADTSKVPAKVLIGHDLYIEEKFNENSLEGVWGWAEKSCLEIHEREIVQFERFGFVLLEKQADTLDFVFVSQ